jgi:hypothetical protein
VTPERLAELGGNAGPRAPLVTVAELGHPLRDPWTWPPRVVRGKLSHALELAGIPVSTIGAAGLAGAWITAGYGGGHATIRPPAVAPDGDEMPATVGVTSILGALRAAGIPCEVHPRDSTAVRVPLPLPAED